MIASIITNEEQVIWHYRQNFQSSIELAKSDRTWWRHQMETFSASLAICAGNSPVPGELPAQRPATRSFDVFFDIRPNKRLSKQSWGWWFETLLRSLWRHRNGTRPYSITICLMVLNRRHDGRTVRRMERRPYLSAAMAAKGKNNKKQTKTDLYIWLQWTVKKYSYLIVFWNARTLVLTRANGSCLDMQRERVTFKPACV